MKNPVQRHTWNGLACTLMGYEFTSACPFVRVRFADGTTKQVKAWELEPKVPVYPKRMSAIF